jgi:hypothetical protein
MTLAQYANIAPSPMVRATIEGLLEYSDLMDRTPFTTVDELVTMVRRIKTLPTSLGFRALNQGFGEGTGDWEMIQEGLADFGTDIDVDRVFTKVKSDIDPRAGQIKLHLKALAYKFNDLFINADRAVDPNGIDGIKVRHAQLAADDPELEIDAGGLDISEAGRTANTVHPFLDMVHRAMYRLEGEPGKKVIICNDRVKLAFLSLFRRGSLLDVTRDNFDRRDIATFMGMPILDPGVKADQITRILPFNSDDPAQTGTSSRTSIYIVSLGEEALHGVQLAPPDTRDIGELEAKPVMRYRLQWTWGLVNWSRRSIARIKNLYVASA